MSLTVDASESQIGAVLQQMICGTWSLLVFFSKNLSATWAKYSAFNRKLLAAYSSVCLFRFLLEGSEFTLFTDHKPLTHSCSVPLHLGLPGSRAIWLISLNSLVILFTFLVLRTLLLMLYPDPTVQIPPLLQSPLTKPLSLPLISIFLLWVMIFPPALILAWVWYFLFLQIFSTMFIIL